MSSDRCSPLLDDLEGRDDAEVLAVRDVIARLDEQGLRTAAWWEAPDGVREADSDHMSEGENESMADFRRHAQGITPADQDPDEYIARMTPTAEQL